MASCTGGCHARFLCASRCWESLQLDIISEPGTLHSFFFLFLSLLPRPMAKNLAAALNAWCREGVEMLGGAEEAGIQELLTDFLGDSSGSEFEFGDCTILI